MLQSNILLQKKKFNIERKKSTTLVYYGVVE